MAIRKKPIVKVSARVNEMLAAIIVLCVVLVSVQMWLLFGTINKALYLYNTEVQVQTFATWSAVGSVVIFLCLWWLLRYVPRIPTGSMVKGDEKDAEYEY